MILPDADLLIYAYNEGSQWHAAARQWLMSSFARESFVGFAWIVVLAFLRLTTNPRVFEKPFATNTAAEIVQSWLDQPNAVLVQPGDRHWPILLKIHDHQLGGNLISDAHLAALAIEHAATLCTSDRDFRRFKGLSLRNPLVISTQE